jgi:glucose dehydrogenase
MRIRYAVIVAVLAILPLLAQTPAVQRGGTAAIAARPGDWPMYNRDFAGTRFSPLTQITTANVGTLRKTWTYSLQPAGGNINPAPASASEVFQQVTPIVVNGVMYLPAGNRVVALEPETGKEIWSYGLTSGLASFRGVAYWPGDATHQPRILFTSLKKMIALNANTGRLDTTFGMKGEVDLKVGYTGVPLIYKNLVFIGAMIFGPGEQHLDAGTYIAVRRQAMGVQFDSAARRIRE